MKVKTVARRIEVSGIVQGVGFRPYIYQLALSHGLSGEVANTAFGVVIRVQGESKKLDAFIADIPENCPPRAQIDKIVQFPDSIPPVSGFSIAKSLPGKASTVLIPPDIAICDDCKKELMDPKDRRYGYPFINCTHCGPRYTIIDNIPYDRCNTTMKVFEMCPACRLEYEDPANRRFHAQPNACALCGPRVELLDAGGRPLVCESPLEESADLLKKGHILAIKGLGGYHLAADAANDQAVQTLRRRKQKRGWNRNSLG